MLKRFAGNNVNKISLACFLNDVYKYTDQSRLNEKSAQLDRFNNSRPKKSDQILLDTINSASHLVVFLSAQGDVKRQAESIARSALSQGKFIAFGNRMLLDGIRVREEIPIEFWDSAKISWKDNSAQDEADHYIRIRVSKQFIDHETITPSKVSIDDSKQRISGRPTRRPMIEAAILECSQKNARFTQMSRLEQRLLVLKCIDNNVLIIMKRA